MSKRDWLAPFRAEDFSFCRMDDCKNGCPPSCRSVEAAERANAIIRQMVEGSPKVRCAARSNLYTGTQWDGIPGPGDTHTARLIAIEPLKGDW